MAGKKLKKKKKKKNKKRNSGTRMNYSLQNSSFLKQDQYQRFPQSDNQHAQLQTITST